jgi:hypothetical protein
MIKWILSWFVKHRPKLLNMNEDSLNNEDSLIFDEVSLNIDENSLNINVI